MFLVAPFPGKFPTFLEYSQETYFLESFFVKVGNSGLQACNVREKGAISQTLFWNFRNFPTFHFEKSICGGIFSLVLGCRLKLCNFLKMEFHCIFSKFSLWLFENTLMQRSVIEVSRVKSCRLWFCVLTKK